MTESHLRHTSTRESFNTTLYPRYTTTKYIITNILYYTNYKIVMTLITDK